MILNKIKTKQRTEESKGSEHCFLPLRRRSSLCGEQSGPLLTQTDEADTTLAQIVFSCRLSFFHFLPPPPLLRFRLVLTLMLTKRFVKQDLSGGVRRENRQIEEEGAMWRHCRAAFDTGTVTQRLKCQVRFLSRGADGERGGCYGETF